MSDLLSGLSSLGLSGLEDMELFEEPKKKTDEEQESKTGSGIEEKDIIYEKGFDCPVCDKKITAKTVKTGKAKLLHTDMDLRSVYDGIDMVKYDVILCPHCGYAALTRYFKSITDSQRKWVMENISAKFKMQQTTESDIVTYEDALQRYQLALANAIVKKTKSSEKAYICLKTAWLLRGWQEKLLAETPEDTKLLELETQEREFLKKALEGFIAARQNESFPMCGMDEITVDYLIAVLAVKFQKYEVASKLVSSILTSPSANNRMKDKARDLKDMILDELRKKR